MKCQDIDVNKRENANDELTCVEMTEKQSCHQIGWTGVCVHAKNLHIT